MSHLRSQAKFMVTYIYIYIYILYIYIYVVTIVLMISVRVFKSGFIFHSVGIRQNWAEKLRGFSDNK